MQKIATRFFGPVLVAASALGILPAQTDASPHFEVASLKLALKWSGQSTPPLPSRSGGPGTGSPTRLTVRNYSLSSLIQYAYSVRPESLVSPSWLQPGPNFGGDRFDIDAELAPGTPKEQSLLMLQNLIVERFSLKFHREQRETAVYELTVAKGGPKFQLNLDPPAAEGTSPQQGPPGTDGFPTLPQGISGYFPKYTPTTIRWKFYRFSMPKFADTLLGMMNLAGPGSPVKRKVLDHTGLNDSYDFYLEYRIVDLLGSSTTSDGGMAADSADAPDMFGAIQSQLGLKLTSAKAMLESFVIDQLERRPSGN